MKVALVYDRINKWGGAERILLALNKMYPEAELYTSLYSKSNTKWARVFKIKTSFLQNFSFFRNKNEFLAALMPIAFESFNFDKYDLVISITSESAKGIITRPGTRHICVCLTPTRYLWSGANEYVKNNFLKFLLSPFFYYLKYWDLIASRRPDEYIAISSEVKKRIKKYYDRESKIIFPPIFINKNIKISKNKKKKDYYLLVSRMSRFSYYKKIDLAIAAFNLNNQKLIIIGDGPLRKKYEKMSNKNITFIGNISDKKMVDYYSNAKALIFPGFEDFGLVMAEAQSLGTPVIAYGKGGARDIVISGKTGEFFNSQTPQSLNRALQKFNQSIYNKRDIVDNSRKFSYNSFKKNFGSYIKDKK